MELPSVQPFIDNLLCRNLEEFSEVISKTLKRGKGGIFKIFGKVNGKPYYLILLIDDEKILGLEAQEVHEGSKLAGDEAVKILKEIIKGITIVDAYPLDEIELKLSIADNIEIYTQTPKISLKEILGDRLEGTEPRDVTELDLHVEERESEKRKKKPKKTEIILKVPTELDPYFRAMVKRLKNEARAFNANITKVEIEARQVRYALGAGIGIHSFLKIKVEAPEGVPAKILKRRLEKATYEEAGSISAEIGKRVVVSSVDVELA